MAHYTFAGKLLNICDNIGTTSSSRDAISWSPPTPGFVKLNCDGSVVDQGRRATCGGILRDHDGNFIFAFAGNLGQATVVNA